MKKQDYLKSALQAGLANKLAWIVSAFCETREAPDDYLKDPFMYRIVSTHNKFQFVNAKGVLEDIEDSSTKEPLFKFKDRIKVNASWAVNIKQEMETGVGNLLFNFIAIVPNFGEKYPFPDGKISVAIHEAYIAPRLTDTPKEGEARDKGKIYVDEYLKFRDSLIYMEQFAPYTSWSATRKGITKSPELEGFKKKLLQEYEGQLDNPVKFAEFENKLKEFDKEWLKDDPAFGTFLKGKILNISRKKMFLSIGIPERLDPTDPIVPITRTLEEGQPTDAKEYTASLNGARFGSYSRGTETINGGVVSKAVIRVGSNFVVDMDDCGTVLGMKKTYNEDTIGSLIGRDIVVNDKLTKIENSDQAKNYLGRLVVVRSVAYCQAAPGDRLCRICAGVALSQHKEGLVIPATEISQLILTQSLKAMHGKELSTAEINLERVIS